NTADHKSQKSKIKSKWMNALDWGSKTIELSLPPVFKYIDDKFGREIDNNFTQKLDDKGRIFYVDNRIKKTSFMHPLMKKREKTRTENETELLHGKLPDGWEVINFKSEKTGEIRLLYIDHNLKKTSWIDPRRKRKIKEY